jgi:hypothetical protein
MTMPARGGCQGLEGKGATVNLDTDFRAAGHGHRRPRHAAVSRAVVDAPAVAR